MSNEEVLVPCSVGDLLDRYSILQVKKTFILEDSLLKLVEAEIKALEGTVAAVMTNDAVRPLYEELLRINQSIWFSMERLFALQGTRSEEFLLEVELSLDLNKERAWSKKAINLASNSTLSEVKSYFRSQQTCE